MTDRLWQDYLDATDDREARPLLLLALEQAPRGGRALDLGCGAGGDTLYLLRRGYEVMAVDALEAAVGRTRERAAAAELEGALDARVARFEAVRLEPDAYQLIGASFSLPFCAPDTFPALWDAIRDALVPGGIFVGQLFGDRDEWADLPEHPAQVFVTLAELEDLLDGYERLHVEEEEARRPTATGPDKDWHIFHLILRKPV